MKTSFIAAASIVAATLGAAPLAAQQGDWEYDVSVYLFMPETSTAISTPASTIESELSFSDAVSNLDFAFMGAFGASNGRWSFLADYMYTDLSFGNPPPGPVFSSIDTTMTTQILSGYAAYRVYEDSSAQIDLAAGFRWFKVKSSMTLQPVPPGRTNSVDSSWVDPVIGLRARYEFSERWTGTAFFDYGGFESGEKTWQALLTADYAINDNWVIRGGYRYITVDHAIGANSLSLTQSGPIFGATYRF